MLIDDQTFKNIYNKITGNINNSVNFNYTGVFIDGGNNNNHIQVHNVLSVDKISKFHVTVSDNIFVALQVYKTVYMQLLAVNRKQLRFQLTYAINSPTGMNVTTGLSIVETYDALLTDNISESIETRSGQLSGNQTDNLGELVEINVQLIERGLSEFRLWDQGGVYRNVTVLQLLQGLMSLPLKTLNQDMTTGFNVTVYPPDNTNIYYQRLIPNGIRLTDLPGFIQKTWGVYSSGLGSYLRKGMWYIYPLYDMSRYNKETKRLTIINIPPNEMMGNPNSYVMIDNELYILTTGITKHIDESDRNLDTTGTGFRTAKAGNLMDKFTQSANGNTVIAPGSNMVSVSYDSRASELTNLKTPDKLLSCNPWADSSRVIMNLTNLIKVTQEYSNHDLFMPYMPVKFIYKKLGKPQVLYGVLLGVESHSSSPLQSSLDKRYRTSSLLTIAVERNTQG